MLLLGDCNDHLKDIKDNSIDLILTDPPYGLEFMGKDWDRVVVPTETWKECFRVLKQGKLAFVMCSPRQDVLSRMIVNLQDAGFRTNYSSIYWTYASGFPKAANVSKLIDKRAKDKPEYYELAIYLKEARSKLGLSTNDIAKWFPSKTGGLTGCMRNWEYGNNVPTEEQYQILKEKLGLDDSFDWLIEQETKRYEEAKREIIGMSQNKVGCYNEIRENKFGTLAKHIPITKPATEEAKKMEGAYVGFQPKPAVEVILILSKGKTLTWLDDCRIPYQSSSDMEDAKIRFKVGEPNTRFLPEYGWHQNKMVTQEFNPEEGKGRFPANLLVSDDVLNDGTIHKSGKDVNPTTEKVTGFFGNKEMYYSKDANYGDSGSYSRYFSLDSWWAKTFPFLIVPKASKSERGEFNSHPTVKALKLMSYLITMGSREGDLVLDPFCGSGTVLIAADQLHRKWLGIEKNPEYAEIIKKRLMIPLSQLKLSIF